MKRGYCSDLILISSFFCQIFFYKRIKSIFILKLIISYIFLMKSRHRNHDRERDLDRRERDRRDRERDRYRDKEQKLW